MVRNVLLVTNEYPPEKTAGTAMSTRFLAEELGRRGRRVTVVVNTRRAAPPREADGPLDVIRLRPIDLPLTRMAQRAAHLIAIARRIQPDIIQGQSVSCGCLAAFAGRFLQIPSATYIQGLDLYQSGRWAQRTYIRWALAASDLVVTVTEDLRRRAWELSGRQGEVIPHGLRVCDAHALDRPTARAQLGLPQNERLVLFVGRLIALKGVTHLIAAMTRVVMRCPDARLIIVGDGEERDSLARLTRALSMEARVVFAGERPHEDVIRFMRAADAFALPSLLESFGMVLIEAMSCGLPVVASDVMGIPSVVEDGRNGFLVRPGDEAGLADRLVQLLVDPGARASIAAVNTQKASGYAYSRIAAQFLSLWEGVVASRSRALGRAVTGADGQEGG